MRKFNLTGVCVPGRHYMVDLSDKVDMIVKDYIEQGAYFTINRARQYGKTTLLSALQRRLAGKYLVIRLSFEAAEEYFASQKIFVNGLAMDIAEQLRREKVPVSIINEWEQEIEGNYPMKMLSRRITSLCSRAGKKVVLMVDEVDKCADNQIFLNFLGMLRSMYLDMQEEFGASFQSVILAGVYDVKNLKLKLRPDEEKKYNSPWNIAADFDVDMSLPADGIKGMLEDYAADRGISMDVQSISEKIYFYTNGYPFLVSWLCKWIDERGGRDWTAENVKNAEKELLNSNNTLFDDLVKNVENHKELKQMVTVILFEGEKIPFAQISPIVNMGVMLGILAERNAVVAVSNIVFETILYNNIIVEKIMGRYSFKNESSQFIQNGYLDMERVLQKFQEVMKAEYRNEDKAFIERQGRLLFLCFIKPIINGKGNYYVEPETRNNSRMDVVISYGGIEYIIELKIWHGQKYRKKGLEQLEEYLDSRNCEKGYLLSFSFQQNKEYIQNTVLLEKSGKKVYEVIV